MVPFLTLQLANALDKRNPNLQNLCKITHKLEKKNNPHVLCSSQNEANYPDLSKSPYFRSYFFVFLHYPDLLYLETC